MPCCAFRPPGLQRQEHQQLCGPSEQSELCSPHPLQSPPRQRGPVTPRRVGATPQPPLHQQGLLWEADSTAFLIGQLKGTGFGKKLGSPEYSREKVWTITAMRQRTPSGTTRILGTMSAVSPPGPPGEAARGSCFCFPWEAAPHPIPTIFSVNQSSLVSLLNNAHDNSEN